MDSEPVFDPKADSPLSDTALRAKKERYARTDTEAILERIAQESLHSAIVSSEPLGTGSNAFDHLVYKIKSEDGRSIVCRINTDTVPATYFPVEAAVYGLWQNAGIASPKVYGVKLRDTQEGIDYMLLESLGTTDLEKYLKEHPDQVLPYARKTGAFLAALHHVPLRGFGMLTLEQEELVGQHASWQEAILVRLDETLLYLEEQQLLSEVQVSAIRKVLTQHDSMPTLPQGLMLHGDYHHANILIDEYKGEVVGAIDVSQSKAGDPLYDLAFYGTYVPDNVFEVVCDGYFREKERPHDPSTRIALYQLRIFLSKAKLRKRFGYEERIGAAINGALHALEKLS